MMMLSNFRSRLRRDPVVSVVRLEGAISTGGIGRGMLNDMSVAPLLERAFTRGKPAAVALAINCPGGSATQSALIAARIRRLADEKDVPVYAFCEDVAGSGGYWLASAADHIYADANSIIGSIGVISASFGLDEFIARYGIERRVHTAGEDKSMLDPFRPERAEDVERLKAIQAVIHDNFKTQITDRRGDRLSDDRDLFTGEVWVGEKAREVGLIDGIGHLVPVMKEKFGDKTRFSVATPRKSLFQRLGAPGAAELLASVNDRALWARYGL
ncbi:MAG: S49 family peptidase [Pseudomonadota bacterium]